jgi:hypothetical protein
LNWLKAQMFPSVQSSPIAAPIMFPRSSRTGFSLSGFDFWHVDRSQKKTG